MGVIAFVATLALAPATFAGGGGIEWVDNYETALAMAQQTGKPLIVKFWTSW
jgi:hypothetical protein